MIFYNNLLAKCFLGKKKHYFMIGGLFFTRYKYLEVWEEMELRIHARQFWECFLLTLIPALGLSLDRKSTRLNSSHMPKSRMPSSA